VAEAPEAEVPAAEEAPVEDSAEGAQEDEQSEEG
jgi:hypothetical protein